MGEAIVKCERCGKRCRGGQGSPEARIHKRAMKGYCGDCAVTAALQQLSNMHGGKLPLPEALRYEHVRATYAGVLAAGNSDLKPEDIDWDEVIANWHLATDTGTLF